MDTEARVPDPGLGWEATGARDPVLGLGWEVEATEAWEVEATETWEVEREVTEVMRMEWKEWEWARNTVSGHQTMCQLNVLQT